MVTVLHPGASAWFCSSDGGDMDNVSVQFLHDFQSSRKSLPALRAEHPCQHLLILKEDFVGNCKRELAREQRVEEGAMGRLAAKQLDQRVRVNADRHAYGWSARTSRIISSTRLSFPPRRAASKVSCNESVTSANSSFSRMRWSNSNCSASILSMRRCNSGLSCSGSAFVPLMAGI